MRLFAHLWYDSITLPRNIININSFRHNGNLYVREVDQRFDHEEGFLSGASRALAYEPENIFFLFLRLIAPAVIGEKNTMLNSMSTQKESGP